MSNLPIDAVILWVDGADPAHQAKLAQHFGGRTESRPAGANASRFHDSGEINYCVASLLKYAPWLRTIFILTDAQQPSLMQLVAGSTYAEKIKIVDHRDIFVGYEQYLPTFNTRAITTMMWRIPGLAENFLYLNDDFMLLRPLQPEHFFKEDKLMLRGQWKQFRDKQWSVRLLNQFKKMLGKPARDSKRRASYIAAMELGACLAGCTNRYFDLPHNPHPFKKSLLQDFYSTRPELLAKNASYKLRSAEQYVSESLMANLAIQQGRVIFDEVHTTVQIKPGEQSYERVRRKLQQPDDNEQVIFACIQTLEKAPEISQQLILEWLDKRVGRLESLL